MVAVRSTDVERGAAVDEESDAGDKIGLVGD
jgi:hypothetical protein